MRIWVNPDKLASLGVTVTDITNAVKAPEQGQSRRPDWRRTRPSRSAIHLQRARSRAPAHCRGVWRDRRSCPVRRLDPAAERRGACGPRSAILFLFIARLGVSDDSKPSQPAALIALYLTPGSNALQTRANVLKMMDEAKGRFPQGLDYITALDTTLAVSAGIHEIYKTLGEALLLVIIVVYIFLQGLRATLIPLLAVPVSLIATFIVFPMLGFSINTLSLLGMVLAIGLVVDDAIVVVEAVEHNIENGLTSARRHHQGDGGSFGSGHRHRTHPGCGLRSHGLHSRHHRPALQAVRNHHRDFGSLLGIQRAHPEPGAFRHAAAAQEASREDPSALSSAGLTVSSVAPPTDT